jgi:hypothetical protein
MRLLKEDLRSVKRPFFSEVHENIEASHGLPDVSNWVK